MLLEFFFLVLVPSVAAGTSQTRAETALAALQTWYNTTSGIWNTCGWWNGANCMTVIADLAEVDDSVRDVAVAVFENTWSVAPTSNPAPGRGNDTYTGAIKHHRPQEVDRRRAGVDVSQWLDGAYDDDAWWALAWIAAYDVTGRQEYLDLAVGVFDDLSKVWPSRCGGGIYWDYTHTYVNAIANELFLSLAAHLANRASNKQYYVDWAQREWDWFRGSGMINANHTINDGLTESCQNNGQTTWTYNQGVILGGLAELYRASPNATFLESAGEIAKAAIATLSDSNGVMHEPCEPSSCTGDGTQFKGIFVRNLRLLHSVAPDEAYSRVITASADSIWTNDRDASNKMGVNWAGPLEQVDASSHSSAMDALVAAIGLCQSYLRMRIPIAVQLGLLVLVTALVGLAVLSIATWINSYNFVVDVQSEGLELVATIKASQIASNLKLLESTCNTIVTRLLIQGALSRFYSGNSSDSNWTSSVTDVQSALSSSNYLDLYQAIIFSRNGQGNPHGLLNVTAKDIADITLPYTSSNGTAVMLGDKGLGYPPALYPNLTYSAASDGSNTPDVYAFSDYKLGLSTALLLGPLPINSSFSLISVTVPIINNTSASDILGYMTVVASAANLQATINSRDGMADTAQILLLGPSRADNRFAPDAHPATATSAPDVEGLSRAEVHYVFEPTPLPGQSSRHGGNMSMNSFALSKYPLAWKLISRPWAQTNDSISDLSTRNEHGYQVAVGAIRPKTSMAQWILLVEETQAEAFAPINQLRKIILACVFGTIGLIILIVPPLVHLAVAPIRRLSEATRKSIEPPSQLPHNRPPSSGPYIVGTTEAETEHRTFDHHMDEKGTFVAWVKHFRRKDRPHSAHSHGSRNHARTFQIPGRVKERKHLVTDELTELTSTFNEMSDELSIQYNRLEERVADRTRELEAAKLAAETANESKTLFIANISHELKTPLNGILGMCAVCMGEDDLPRIKKSLQVVYKSGDLLLHLLNDLLTFSKNQIDQAIRLEEREFRLSDIRSQLAVIFQNQVQEKQIDFNVNFVSGDTLPPKGDAFQEKILLASAPALGPPGTGRLRDMVLWGDQHRILQILINLVSNSLKFTPERGKVEVRIKCVREVETPGSPRSSMQDSRRHSRLRSRPQSHASSQPRDPANGLVQEEYHTPVLSQLRTLIFQFEVQDNGPGVAPHLQKRIFEPFVQGDLGLNRKYGGTGLGLSICAQLSRLMNGTVTLESEQGKGALFTVEIPLKFVKEAAPSTRSSSAAGSRTPSVFSLDDPSGLARSPSNNGSVRSDPLTSNFEKQDLQPRLVGLSQPFFTPTPSSPAPSTPRASPADGPKPEVKDSTSGKVRVLVAEDNVVNQEVVLRMLRLEEVYDVTVVKDGQEAYDTVKANMEEGKVFDLIFMDIQMPNLDGLQSTRLIRGMGYSAPIVALSAFSEESNIKDCMDSGMDMFISKPIRRPALKQVLNKFATILEEPENVTDS
ncbi:hypothetical protein CNMCM7691_005167 [Aspergillus felis]|uniref:histidine kinase n=1 Tax=Aspergillus felis TaxID=1287682 RepID=A0A8H6QSV2_9EURO|nr:hypothetical protein CNMCM7691_005167 [Aspergillus felis]